MRRDQLLPAAGRNAVVDALLALLCAAVTIGGVVVTTGPRDDYQLDTAGVLLILGQTLPVAWRRRQPVLAWLVAGAAITVYGVGHFPDTVLDVGPLLVIYTVAAETPRRTANVVGIVTALTIVVALWTAGDADARDVSFNVLVYALAWILGENQRSRRAQAQQDAERAVASERARIASELHDVVAHHVSTMVVQAEAGASVARADPERTQVFDAISAAGREAMAEMRRVVGVLSGDDAKAGLSPQPGLDEVDGLAERVRQCGISVDVVLEGPPRPLPSGLDLSAYRIVQEALTNTVRHAEAAHATVVVRYLDDWLELEVADDGRGAGGGDGQGGGHGLVGMRERVALFGGELRAGPRDGGGFAVVARLRT